MNASLFDALGQAAGVAGIAIGLLVLFVKQLIGPKIIPVLSQEDANRLLSRVLLASWSIALLGLAVWSWDSWRGDIDSKHQLLPKVATQGGVAVGGDIENSDIRIESGAPPESKSWDASGVSSEGGVSAGGDVSRSKIDIRNGDK